MLYSLSSHKKLPRIADHLKKQEDRYTKAYGEGIFSLEKLRELTTPMKEKIAELELKIAEVQQEPQASNDLPILEPHEVELFAYAARERLHNLSFEQKRGIVMNVVDLIVSQPNELQVRGRIPLTTATPSVYNLFLCIDGQMEEITNNHVEFETSDRYRAGASQQFLYSQSAKLIPFEFTIALPAPLKTGIDYGFLSGKKV